MRRHVLGLCLFALLAASAGCVGLFGPGPVDYEALSANVSYEWNHSVDAYIEVHRTSYAAVYNVSAKVTGEEGTSDEDPTIELYERDVLGSENPLEIRALKYRYPNGTVVTFEGEQAIRIYPNGTTEATDALAVSKTRKRTIVELPSLQGKLAFTASKTGKSVSTPTFVEGSYEMVLPSDARVGVPLLAQIQPAPDRTILRDDKVHIVWNTVTRAPAVVVRYYLQRDLLIFGGLVGAMIILGLVGSAYYYLQIRETVKRREEVGLDVDVGDDEGKRPPPGMR